MQQHHHHNKIQETPIAAAPVAVAAGKPGESGAGVRDAQPTADKIRGRAYEISQARKGGPGSELKDWIQAEQELKAGHVGKK